MTDQRLRQLAREASALHTPEAEAALLRARLRAGSLTYERLELAAYCGHEWAQATLKETNRYAPWCSCDLPGPGSGTHSDACEMRPWQFQRWVDGLSRWGAEVLARASIAAARAAKREHDAHCVEHSGERCEDRCWGWGLAVDAAESWIGMGLNVSDHEGYPAQQAYDEAWSKARHRAPWLPAPWACAALAGESQVRDAIRSALISWALAAPAQDGER